METNKYYTPELSEYHIGFEYEFEDFNESGSTMSWYKSVIKDGTQIDDITRTHKGEEVYSIRVKLLDREDVKSLGWRQIDYDTFDMNGGQIRFEFNSEYKNFIYTPKHNLFVGAIKNKSELKKIMTQLNIK